MKEMTMEQKQSVVRAIDLGYGFTKLTVSVDSDGSIMNKSFPSIATKAGDKNLGQGFLKSRDTVEVLHNNVRYEVGRDVVLSTDGYSKKVLNKNYTKSIDYDVLMKGALKMMKVEHIDILVIGAPVNKHKDVKAYLKNHWQGLIDLDGDLSVQIDKVVVLPQPLGGFAFYGNESGNYNEIKAERNLIIDPGYFTLDWLLIENMKVMEGSGSYEGGMSFVIDAIVNSLDGEDANNLSTITRVDEYFYKNRKFKIDGEAVDLKQYQHHADSVIENSIQAMLTKVSNIRSIDNIIVIGGAGSVYLPILKKSFKGRTIHVSKGKSFSNVLGYHFIGSSMQVKKG